MFKPGQSGNPKGREKGSKNKLECLGSLRSILGECFSQHRAVIIIRINRLLQETSDINDFKWLMNLKASLEPKTVEVDAPQNQQIVLIRANAIDVESKPADQRTQLDNLAESPNGLNGRITTDNQVQA